MKPAPKRPEEPSVSVTGTGSCHTALLGLVLAMCYEVGLKLVSVPLPQPSECWDVQVCPTLPGMVALP